MKPEKTTENQVFQGFHPTGVFLLQLFKKNEDKSCFWRELLRKSLKKSEEFLNKTIAVLKEIS